MLVYPTMLRPSSEIQEGIRLCATMIWLLQIGLYRGKTCAKFDKWEHVTRDPPVSLVGEVGVHGRGCRNRGQLAIIG